MHLIKIVYGNDRGGIFSCESQYIGILKSRGVHVYLIIVGEGVSADRYEQMVEAAVRIKGFDIRFCGTAIKRIMKLFWTFGFGLRYAFRLKGKYKQIDIAGITYRREAFMFLGGILAFFLKTTCYWHMANTVNTKLSRVLNTAVCRLFRIIPLANSIYTKHTLGPVCKYVVYPGFGIDRLEKPFDQDQFGLPIQGGLPVFGMIARVCEDKAQDILVEGFVKSDAVHAGSHLVLAGNVSEPSFLAKIREIAGAYWDKQVHYIGVTDEAAKFYDLIDVAINARRNAEPFGISIAEALHMKKPIISYYEGGPSEMIESGENGWLVYEVSSDAYSETINKSLLDREKWGIMGDKSFEKAPPFSSSVNVEKLVSIISSGSERLR